MANNVNPAPPFRSAADASFAQGPLHARIEHEMRRMMEMPEFQGGKLLPTELTLANRFGVSRATVRCALMRLVDKGLLERKPGVGTRVKTAPAETSMASWRSLSQEMAHRNIIVESYLIEAVRVAATAPVANALGIAEETELLRVDRVRGWKKTPVLQSRSWFHPRLNLATTADFSRPLYKMIEDMTGAVADSSREEITAMPASSELAERLKVGVGEPLIVRAHTVFDVGKRPMEFAEVHYVSSRFKLTLDLKREVP